MTFGAEIHRRALGACAAAGGPYECEEHRRYRESRRARSDGEFLLLAGEDVSGAARIDPQRGGREGAPSAGRERAR
jgi:hypothetical protein